MNMAFSDRLPMEGRKYYGLALAFCAFMLALFMDGSHHADGGRNNWLTGGVATGNLLVFR